MDGSDRPESAASKPAINRFASSASGASLSSSAQVRRSFRLPAEAKRLINRSAMASRTIGRFQNSRSRKRLITASRSESAFASIAHQRSRGRWMSAESSSWPTRFFTIARHSGPGRRRAEQASWLRASTSASTFARSASFDAT